MADIYSVPTPSFLVDLDILTRNIKEMAVCCQQQGKELWPMMKTHKSTTIARWQSEAGVNGFLAGTIDEAERLVEVGFREIMLAYPVAAKENIARVIDLARKARIILSFDGGEAASQWENQLEGTGLQLEYLIIVDSGLHRFGVAPDEIVALAQELHSYQNLVCKGISTHPGHVYAASCARAVQEVAAQEAAALAKAKERLESAGYQVDIVATGSTPTIESAVQHKAITVLRPGNYVFYDAMQVALGVVSQERCALTVLATVIANPKPGLFIIDAGSKCFGLDKGAHGISLTSGYGIVKDHPEAVVEGLSEEVGKIRVNGKTSIKVGNKVRVIPNHACSAANMTSYLIGHRNDVIQEILKIDVRGGSYRKPPVV